jgi:EAL domain-containing protein (putative c-di-GMP-specific phosphodiesterase class I)
LLSDRAAVFAINISGPTLGDAAFVEFVIDQLKASGIAPRAFSFELPERDVLADPGRAAAAMHRLRDAGCAVALDNFGTGLSSLAQLRALPLDMLKIDGSFVRDVLTDPRAESMVHTMAQMAHSMNLVTVAGQVETDELRQRLAQLGVDYGQGFVIAQPAPLAAAIRDLPTCVAVARRRQGEELELGDEEDTISAELQQQLLAGGIAANEHDAAMSRMEKVLAGHDHSQSVLYQRKSG